MTSLKAENLFNVKGLVALVTGGSSGLGSFIAHALAENGASKVYVFGRREEKLKEVASNYPDIIIPITGNVDNKADLFRAAEIVRSDTGYLNLLIANAGISDKSPLTMGPNPSLEKLQNFACDLTEDDWGKVLNTNLVGAFFTVASFLDLLSSGNTAKNVPYSSQVIAMSAIASFIRSIPPGGFAYTISKAAMTHLFKILSTMMLPYNIRSNIICPGLYQSEMADGFIESLKKQSPDGRIDRVPEGRAGQKEDMAGVILFLASSAGSFCNGMVMITDGGTVSREPATY